MTHIRRHELTCRECLTAGRAGVRDAICLLLFLTAVPLVADETKKTEPVPLNPQRTVFFDKPNEKLILKTSVCLRDGLLEMLLCPRQTKEHESILAIDSSAQVVHAGLLALGAAPGRPALFEPEFSPPRGEIIRVDLLWKDSSGKSHRARAQDWIRCSAHRYFETSLRQLPEGVLFPKKPGQLIYDDEQQQLIFFGPMTAAQQAEFLKLSSDDDFQAAVNALFQQGEPKSFAGDFLFAGSGFARTKAGKEVYQAESGSLICVANFSDSLLDVSVRSTASNDAGLLFEAWTERVPPVGTEVIMELSRVKTAADSVPAADVKRESPALKKSLTSPTAE